MRLTPKGMNLFLEWESKYYKELCDLKEETNDPNYHEGWCIIDNGHYVRNIEDQIGLLVFGYDDDVIFHLEGFKEKFGENEEYSFGYTAQDIIDKIMKEGYVTDDDEDGEKETNAMDAIKLKEATTITLSESALWKKVESGIDRTLGEIYKELGVESGDFNFEYEDDWSNAISEITNIFKGCINYNLSDDDTEVFWA